MEAGRPVRRPYRIIQVITIFVHSLNKYHASTMCQGPRSPLVGSCPVVFCNLQVSVGRSFLSRHTGGPLRPREGMGCSGGILTPGFPASTMSPMLQPPQRNPVPQTQCACHCAPCHASAPDGPCQEQPRAPGFVASFSSTGRPSLAPPQNVTLLSGNFSVYLTWLPGPGHPQNVTYLVAYKR